MSTPAGPGAGPIGQPLTRVDGAAKVTGRARYAADFRPPGQLCHARVLTSSIAVGRIDSIDSREALGLPGVLAVISHLNAARLPYREHHGFTDPHCGERLHVLQDAQVHFYGQPVAVVVAESLEQAEHAAAAVQVRYRAEAPAIGLETSVEAGVVPQAARERGGRVQADYDRGNAEDALRGAAVRVDARYAIAREHHNPIELHAAIAAWEGERLTLWSKSQFLVSEAAEIAAVFGLDAERVQVICPYIGGAFGTGLRTWPHVTIAALAARAVGRPVKLVLTRRQMFYATGYRPRTLQRVALGATADGHLQALIHEGCAETSRYEQYIEALTSATPMMYACANVRTRYRLQPLDVSTPTFMRAPGEASGNVALECAIDELAGALGIDPLELRRRNEPLHDQSRALPFSSRSLLACLQQGAERFGWSRRQPQPRSMRDGRQLIGYGLAAASYPAHRGQAHARARLLADGSAEIETAASDMGPGTYTSLTQIAAETLGLPVEKVHVRIGRSDLPAAPPHGGSQTTASVGSAVQAACRRLRELAAHRHEAPAGAGPLQAEAASGPGPERQRYSMHSFAAVFVELGIDAQLLQIRVRRMLGVYAVGRVINPKLARSQCLGGMIGGLGMALMERTRLDRRDGRPVEDSLADALVPVTLDTGQIEAQLLAERDTEVDPLGAKGIGELGYVGSAAAIANALFHATGARLRALPIDAASLAAALAAPARASTSTPSVSLR